MSTLLFPTFMHTTYLYILCFFSALCSADALSATAVYPCLSLAEDGFSCGDVSLHGFSLNQLSASVDGYNFSDAGTQGLDLHDLPLFATDSVEVIPNISDGAIGGAIRLELPVPPEFSTKAHATLGSHGFGVADIAVTSGDLFDSRIRAGIKVTTTDHDDARRKLGFVKSEHRFKNADLNFLRLSGSTSSVTKSGMGRMIKPSLEAP